MTPIQLQSLRRRPDVEAPELVAVDAADRLLLDTAMMDISTGVVAVINDHYGALTLGALQLRHEKPGLAGTSSPRVFQDGIVHERALSLNAAALGFENEYENHPLGQSLFADASTVLLHLPRSLDELDELAWWIAACAPPDVRVFAVGRVKHMSVSMNAVLGRHFGSVSAGLARQKSRVLLASEPHQRAQRPSAFPRSAAHDVGLSRPLQVRAYGATFGGASLDPGTRLLLPHLRTLGAVSTPGTPDTRDPRALEIVDLGCGNGVISAVMALLHPAATIHATDQSASAVASTVATTEANGVAGRVKVTRDDALSAVPDGSVRTIVLNPPFHLGSTVHSGIAHKLFSDCARALQSGGVLLVVWNSHLHYRPILERFIGPTVQLDRSSRFTVTRSIRR